MSNGVGGLEVLGQVAAENSDREADEWLADDETREGVPIELWRALR